jgi:hypothetical protein
MKKRVVIHFFLVVAFLLSFSAAFAQQQNGDSQQTWQCPRMGQGASGRHARPGNRGIGCPRAATGNSTQSCPADMIQGNQGKPLSAAQANELLENYLLRQNNPNLKLGDVKENGDIFEASITTKDGSLVEKIQVDRKTGWFRRAS